MKVSALIEYLVKYLRDNGDVDLDVEIGGAPKTPPPSTVAHLPISKNNDLNEIVKELQKSWDKDKKDQQPSKPWKPQTDGWDRYDDYNFDDKYKYF